MKETRRRGTRRRKTGSPVLTWPSGYAASSAPGPRTRSGPGARRRPRRVSVAATGRPNETRASATHATAARPRPIKTGLSSSGMARGARGPAPAAAADFGGCDSAPDSRAGSEPAAERDQGDEADEERAVQRLAQPLGRAADRRRADPQAADDLLLCRPLDVEEAVVVALEHEPALLDADDPVEHLGAELLAVVEDDVAGAVDALRADDREVAAMQPGLHRVADDDRVGGAAARLRRREEDPAGRERDDGEDAGGDPGEASGAHAVSEGGAGRDSVRLARPGSVDPTRSRSPTAGRPS